MTTLILDEHRQKNEQGLQGYYDATSDRPVRQDLITAVNHLVTKTFALDLQSLSDNSSTGSVLAIDCGCGAGSDIAFLRLHGFTVYAFDVEASAIKRCQERFADDPQVHLAQASFHHYQYPQEASLVVADASLFFCPPQHFHGVWNRITSALRTGGIFVGSFLGPDDAMAQAVIAREEDSEADNSRRRMDAAIYWPEVLVVTEATLRSRLEGDFEILSWHEHRTTGQAPGGDGKSAPHSWHIFSVVAVKVPV